jgi:hypothetical protein
VNHTESEYIEAGYRYERAQSPDAGRARAEAIRAMLATENQKDHAEARALIERGRAEARTMPA